MFWAGAHTLNTVVDYRLRVAADGIAPPRHGLNIHNCANNGRPAAPMLQDNPYNSWVVFLLNFFPPAYNFYNVLSSSLHPDIVIKYGDNDFASRVITDIYHELGHASHHRVVGETYWVGYRNHIINNNGYGAFGDFSLLGSDPGKVALGEAFGNYIANRYGTTANGGDLVSFDLSTTGAENFIPRGLMFDLVDNTNDIIIDPNDGSSTVDNITGFTPAMIFDGLSDPFTDDIRKFRNRLRILHLQNTPNSLTDYNNFLDQYDVFN